MSESAEGFLKQFATKAALHKFVDDLKEGDQLLILQHTPCHANWMCVGDLTWERAVFMCQAFLHNVFKNFRDAG